MKTRNSTKSKLLSSVIALVLCVSMLIGATFAWFTDTASTAVNKIQAGNLDIQLLAEDGTTSLEGKTLSWQKVADHENESVLWEPGCTYFTDGFQIKNAGDLNLKFKIAVNGITSGDATLLNAIDFYLTTTKSNDLSSTGAIPLNSFTSGEFKLAPGKFWRGTTDSNDTGSTPTTIYLAGHMKEDAGNEYQGLTIDGIGITVFATQVDAESDSFGNTYDQNAGYIERHATIMGDDGKTITLEQGKTYTVGNGKVEVDANGNITYTNAGAAQTVTIQTDGGTLTVDAPLDTVNHYGEANFVNVTAIAGNSYHEFGKVAVLELAKGRVVVENGDNIGIIQIKADNAENNPVVIAVPQNVVLDTKIEKASGVGNVNLKVINSNGADTTITTTNGTTNETIPVELKKVLVSQGQNGTIGEAKDYVARIGNTPYATLNDALTAAAAQDSATTVTLMKSVDGKKTLAVSGNVTLDLAGYKIVNKLATIINNGTLTIKNGTVESTANVAICAGNNSKTTIESGIYTGREGAVITGNATGATINIKGGTFEATDNAVIGGNGTRRIGEANTINISGGTFNGGIVSNGYVACGIYAPWKDVINVSGGTFNITGGAGIVARAGNVTVTGGTFNCTGNAEVVGKVGDSRVVVPCSVFVFDSSAKYPALAADSKITVTGGTFTSEAPCIATVPGTDTGRVVVTGGSFTDLVSALKYAASGATIGLAQDAQGGGLGSADLNKATYRENLTIDFNGHTYTVVNNAVGSTGTESQAMHWGKSLGAVTLKNGTFKVSPEATSVKMAMQNYIKFTAENMKFDFSTIVVSTYGEAYKDSYPDWYGKEVPMFCSNGAPITMTNCTVKMPAESKKGITADKAGSSSTITLNNCTIDGYVCCVDTDSKVINNDSTWKGFVSYFDNYVTTNKGNEYSVVLSTPEAE